MKINQSIFLIPILFLLSNNISHSQTINWGGLQEEQKQIININAGLEYSIVYGAAFSYRLKSKLPILLNVDISVPAGDIGFDDLKTKIGGQVSLLQVNKFHLATTMHGVYRRYQNQLVRLQNFGSDTKGIFGYYDSKWFFAAEVGFDKAIVSHFKHSNEYRSDFPEVKDGWFEPATGGNFNYGIQTGFSFRSSDVTLKLGKILTQDFKTEPTLPIYMQLGYNYKL